MAEAERLGVNPFRFGAIASTDTHDGAPGDVDEALYDGSTGRRLNDFRFNPGGLAVVWAEENSRAALFDGMRRRETYGTSGPRITARFFGGGARSPFTSIAPWTCASSANPASTVRRLVLPLPLGPIRPVRVPGRNVVERGWMTSRVEVPPRASLTTGA